MKIALATERFDSHCGGIEGFAFELARHLLRLKHEVHVVGQHFCETSREMPIVPHRLRSARSLLRRDSAAEKQLRSIGADIIHDMGVTCYADVFSPLNGSPLAQWQRRWASACWWRRPFARALGGWQRQYRQQLCLARRQLEESDSIVLASSERIAEEYHTLHGFPPDRIRVVHPGVDIKKFSPHVRKLKGETTRRKLGIGSQELFLLAFEDEHDEASWRLLFLAVKRLNAKRIPSRLVIGARHCRPSATRMADRFGVASHVTHVGTVADLIPYYAAANVLLVTARKAVASPSVLEAAACGLPSITSRENGNAELLTDGTDGFILANFSPAGLAERVEAMQNPTLAERMGRAARRTAMKYPANRSYDRVVRLYEQVVQARQNSPSRDILQLSRDVSSNVATRRAA